MDEDIKGSGCEREVETDEGLEEWAKQKNTGGEIEKKILNSGKRIGHRLTV